MASDSINKVVIEGRLGSDPDVKPMPSGDVIVNISVATEEAFKDRTGKERKETEWHQIVAYKSLAKAMAGDLRKGLKVNVEGRLKTQRWNDRQGEPKSRKVIVALSYEIVVQGGRNKKQSDAQSSRANAPNQGRYSSGRKGAYTPSSSSSEFDMDSGIPEDF
jgi:single-strand DNA-binding protein